MNGVSCQWWHENRSGEYGAKEKFVKYEEKKMKKSRLTVLFFCLVGAMLMLGGCGNKEKLSIYLPGEYMSEEIIPTFEKMYNCKVDVENFDSNEMMYTKVMAGDVYDVLIPSDYMIEKLINENMLQKLDMSKITNLDKVNPTLQAAPYNNFDPANEYAVPYFWGTVGIVYNKTNVDYADLENENFDILRDTKYKDRLYMYDSERDAFMIALKSLGYSMNTDNMDEINAAYEWLAELNSTMNPTTVTDDVIDGMAQGRKDLAIVYSGDATYILSENEEMGYYVPTCGTNVWVDAMVIPANAENPDLAHKFIDFMLSYDAQLLNTEEVGYTAVNVDVYEEMIAEGGLYADNEAYIPRAGYEKDECFRDVEVLRKAISELWIKAKASK